MKIATVIGATGLQGTATIAALLENPEYRIRGITRNPDGEAATSLTAKGIQMVQADITDIFSLIAAFGGSHLIFGSTDYVELFRNGKAYDGKLGAENFDGKAEVNDYIRSTPSLLAKTTFLMVGWYDINLNYPIFTPAWIPSAKKYVIIGDYAADATVPMIGDVVQNLRPFITAIVNQPQKTKDGNIVMAFTEKIGFEDMLEMWAQVHSTEALYVKTPVDIVERLWGEQASLANMARFMGVYKEGIWTYREDEVLTANTLGVPESAFVPLTESFKKLRY